MKPVIAFYGAAGSGKDTCANHLVEKFGARKVFFAAPLKRLCARIFGWDFNRLEELAYKEEVSNHHPIEWTDDLIDGICEDQGLDPIAIASNLEFTVRDHLRTIFEEVQPSWTRRRILQWVGTEGFRVIDVGHWVRQGVNEIRAIQQVHAPAGIVVSDTRFPNEFAAIRREFGGTVVKLEREGRENATEHPDHASETAWADTEPDATISAPHGALDSLRDQAARVWDGLLTR